MRCLGGLPASIGIVFALGAVSNAVSSLFGDGVFTWAEVADRDDERRSCAPRVTLLAAPAGC